MRRVSPKRQRLLKIVGPIREAIRRELQLCEYCRKRSPILHEISRGGTRKASLDKRFAILGLCHPACHELVGGWCRAKQLALLLIRRPQDFDLKAYWELIRRRTPDIEEVLEWRDKLMEELK